MSLESAQSRSEKLAATLPKAEKPKEAINPMGLEMSERGATESREHPEVQQESITEAGERKVAELKAAVEEKFGGFFAGVRSRAAAIQKRAAQLLFGAVGAGMEVGNIAKNTVAGGVELASAFNPMNSLADNGKENIYGNIAADLKEEFAPVVDANVAAVKAVGRGVATGAAMGVGLGVMGAVGAAGLAMEGGRAALAAGQRGKEAVSTYSADKVREIDSAIANAKISLEGAKGAAKTKAEAALRHLEAQKLSLQIGAGELRTSAGLRVDQMVAVVKNKYSETTEGAQAALRHIDAAIVHAQALAEHASGVTKTAAENALRTLQMRKLDAEITLKEKLASAKSTATAAGRGALAMGATGVGLGIAGAVGAAGMAMEGGRAALAAGQRGKEAIGTYTAEKMQELDDAIASAKATYDGAKGVAKTKAENVLRTLQAQKADVQIAATNAAKAAGERAVAAKDATIAGAKAVGRGAATVGMAGVGVGVLAAQGGYELGRRGIAGTIAGAEVVSAKIQEKGTQAKERYDATMESLNNKLENAVGFMAKMKIRMEMAKAILRRNMNEIRVALTTDNIAAEEPEVYTGTMEAIDDLDEVDTAAAQERVESVA